MSYKCADNHLNHVENMAIAINNVAEPVIPDDKLPLVKEMFAKGCNDAEFARFVYTCNTLRLNPFANQIYCLKYSQNRPASIFISSAGMLEIANRSGLLNGIESTVTMSDDGKKIISATAVVHKKNADYPFVKTVYFKEYAQSSQSWQSKPITMIEKVAVTQALRLAFSISGIYSEEERWDDSNAYRNQQNECDDIDVTPFVEEPVVNDSVSVENGGDDDVISLF